jgi:protein deglycase
MRYPFLLFIMHTALVILAEGFEELEAIAPIDILRRAGVKVTVAALAESIHVTGRNNITLHADTPLSAVGEGSFDVLVLPGGPGVKLLRADPRIRVLVTAQAKAQRWLAAICAAPTVLHDAGLLNGLRYTAHFSVKNDLHAIIANERTVVDGRVITSRGAGTAIDFGLVLVEKLVSPQAALEISQSISA